MRPVTDLQRRVAPFDVVTDMVPAGDQPAAIAEMEKRIAGGAKDTVLLGATGTGKTATVAWLSERLQRPVLVMLPNKTLAAQFANELREQGYSPAAAAIEAARTRLRPVLMTALAMILGMLPMALALGEGGEQNAPLGRAVIGGLLFATFASL